MKKCITLWLLSLLLVGMNATAATVKVRTNIWTGTQEMDAAWKGYVQLAATYFAQAQAGNSIAISYTTPESGNSQMALKTMSSGWPLLTGTSFTTLTAGVSGEQTISITADMLTELQATGLIVGGCNYTVSKIDLIKEVETSDMEKGNPVTNVWTGNQPISWTGTKSWQTLEASLFTQAKAGNKLRFSYSNLACGAQAHISSSTWGDITDATDYKSLSSSYYEYTITEAMLTELQKNGCIVNGIGYTLTSVDIIDPTQIPSIECNVEKTNIKCWEKNETPVITLHLQNLESKEQTVTATVKLRTDAYVDYKTYTASATIASGETGDAVISITGLQPGFYHAVVLANYGEVADFNIGYDPTNISSPADAQSDFKEFWDKAKKDLAAVEPNYTLTKIEEKSTSKRNVYLVEMNSIDDGDGNPVTIRGYYAEPVAAGTYPVIITQNGYDSDANIPALNFCPSGDSNPGWIELNLSVRGQVINNRGDHTNKYGDWFAHNFGKRDSYYYRGAYMDVVRSIDFIASREKAQKENIFMMGGSQGGALTIAGAALDTRLNAIAPAIQFMGDFPDYFKVGAWPASVAKKQQESLGLSDEDMYKMLSYFDTKNLAPYITCPVLTCMGLQDPVCPPHTNFAPYNNLTVTDKQYIVNGELKHQTATTWYNDCLAFFKNHIKSSEVEGETVDVNLNLWKGNLNVDSWSVWQQLPATKFSMAAVGDELKITIPSLVEDATSHQLMLNNGSWSILAGTETQDLTTAPYTYQITITENMLSELNDKGMIVKGIGFNLGSVDLIHKVKKGDSENKGNAVTNVWNGDPVAISWTTDNNHSELISADKFANAKAGNKIRVSYSNLGVATATGRILADWTAFSGLKNVTFNGGSYYEYTLTDDMLTAITEKKGLRISGNAYTLTSVDIIDPAKEYTIISQYDEADIKAWEPRETPKLGMTITNIETIPVTTTYKVTILRDMVDDDTQTRSIYQTYQQEVTLAAGETKHVDILFDKLTAAGFYKLTANVNNNDVCSYNIGYNPTGIVSGSTAPKDFWTYWNNAKKELASVDANIQLEELTDKSSSKRKIYLVTMKSAPDAKDGTPVTIRGYYAEPVAEGKYPTLLHFQGTDGGSGTPWCPNADDNEGYCEFVLSVRGQMLNNREPNLSDNVYGRDESTGKTDYYSYGWGDKEKHYYRGAYLDCVRAVDFLKAQTKVDVNNIFAVGGSQGGCFTYVAAGLTGAFKAIAPSITGHADFVDGMKIVNWPRANFLAAKEKLGMTDDEMNEFNAYYDVMNFASHINCPTITSFSLQDTTDPPHTNVAPFNLLINVKSEDKRYVINPFLGHGTASDWGTTYLEFFKKYISEDAPAGSKTAEVTSIGFATFVPTRNVVVPEEGVKVYTAAIIDDSKVELSPVEAGNVLGANEGFVIAADADSYDFIVTPRTAATLTNELKAATSEVVADGSQYVLAQRDNMVGFAKATPQTTIAKGNAYLEINGVGNTRSFYPINDSTTGIANIASSAAESNSIYYSLSGMKTSKPQKGIYICNGKKTVLKLL